jgi:hypothetical protein
MMAGVIVPLLLICLTALPSPANAEGRQVWTVPGKGEQFAPVQSAAFDRERGTVYLATLGNLFEVRDGMPHLVAEPPVSGAQILLAPGGELFAWLLPNDQSFPEVISERREPVAVGGPYLVNLMDLSGERLTELRHEKPPFGCGALILGHQGRIIVTIAALDDWQGVHGRYRYTFWRRDGEMLANVVRPEREIPVAGADGRSLLLLGKKEALAYTNDGKLIWRLDGRFRKAAIGSWGKLALLNPADKKAINQVLIYDGSEPKVAEIPTPVHHLRLAPDGSTAVVGGDRGRYFFLEPGGAQVKEGRRLPFEANLFISDLELIDRETVAVGVLLGMGEPPRQTWARGGLVVVNRDGKIQYRSEHTISEPLASRPGLDATYELPYVIGFTLDMAVLVELEH